MRRFPYTQIASGIAAGSLGILAASDAFALPPAPGYRPPGQAPAPQVAAPLPPAAPVSAPVFAPAPIIGRPYLAQPPEAPPGRDESPEAAVTASALPPATRSGPSILGVMTDAGTPDGLMASLVLRPTTALRLHGGGGSNSASMGYRAGVTLIPLGVGPSFSAEAGHYSAGDTNTLVRTFVGAVGRLAPVFRNLSYTFVNLHAGLDFGSKNLIFFVHAGASYARMVLHEVGQALVDTSGAPPSTTGTTTQVTVNEDPVLSAWIPSFKAGLVLFF